MTVFRRTIRITSFLGLALLSACSVSVDEPGPRPRPDRDNDRPQMCTREYDPVCAGQGRREQTFPNGCVAEAEGFRVTSRGECSAQRPDFGMSQPVDDSGMRPPRGRDWDRDQDRDRDEDRDDNRGRDRDTQNNQGRDREGTRDRDDNRGRDRDRPSDDEGQAQVCTREFAPVCARQGRREQTFANSCMAEAEGFRVTGNGACQ